MSLLKEEYQKRVHELEKGQQDLIRRLSWSPILITTLGILTLLMCFSTYGLYQHFSEEFLALPLIPQASITTVLLVLILVPFIIMLIEGNVRHNTEKLLTLCQIDYDITVGVYEALNAYFGDSFLEYNNEMGSLGVGTEIFRSAKSYRERMDRIIHLVNRAVEMLNIDDAVSDIQDLPAHARLTMKKARGIQELLQDMPSSIELTTLIHQLEEALEKHSEGISVKNVHKLKT